MVLSKRRFDCSFGFKDFLMTRSAVRRDSVAASTLDHTVVKITLINLRAAVFVLNYGFAAER